MTESIHNSRRGSSYRLAIVLLAMTTAMALGAESQVVRVEPVDANGSCQIAAATQASVIRNYLQAWKTMSVAFDQNTPASLEADFTGVAKDKLAATIHQQQELGLKTHYQDQKHEIKVVFCSPEGLSVQLTDDVEYDLGVEDQSGNREPQRVQSHYVAVLTPTETRWKIRVFQAEPQP
jgi:hypothetical protein